MRQLFLLIFICISITAFSQDTKIDYDTLKAETEYFGKNIFVKNSFDSKNGLGFTCQKVLINGEDIDTDVNATAFEIKLEERKEGEKLLIEIIHIIGSKPAILNLTN